MTNRFPQLGLERLAKYNRRCRLKPGWPAGQRLAGLVIE